MSHLEHLWLLEKGPNLSLISLRPFDSEIMLPIFLRGTYAQKKVRVSCRYKKKKKKKKKKIGSGDGVCMINILS